MKDKIKYKYLSSETSRYDKFVAANIVVLLAVGLRIFMNATVENLGFDWYRVFQYNKVTVHFGKSSLQYNHDDAQAYKYSI